MPDLAQNGPAPADVPPGSRFLCACRGQETDRPPLWLMRQAGRYLPEYRAVRERAGDFLTLCGTPELAVEVTLQPIRRFGFDAAILFSDILIPAQALGAEVTFTAGEGPKILNPVRSAADVEALACPDPEEACGPTFEAIRLLREALGPTPLIAFAAGPFTLACYMVDGETSRDFRRTRGLLHDPDGPGEALLAAIGRYTARHLAAGVRAGASALMLFESWAGLLGPGDLERLAIAPARAVIASVRAELGEPRAGEVPVIYFAQGIPSGVGAMLETGASVLGLDWRLDLARASREVGDRAALQGNLDPTVLLTRPALVRRRALDVLERGAGHRRGHIMNLGHGITPETPIACVEALVETVRGFGRTA